MIQQWIKRRSRGTGGKKKINAAEQRRSPSKKITTPVFLSCSTAFSFFILLNSPGLIYHKKTNKKTPTTSIRKKKTWIFLVNLRSPKSSWMEKLGKFYHLSWNVSSFLWGFQQTVCLVCAALAAQTQTVLMKSTQISGMEVQAACPFLFWIPRPAQTVFMFIVKLWSETMQSFPLSGAGWCWCLKGFHEVLLLAQGCCSFCVSATERKVLEAIFQECHHCSASLQLRRSLDEQTVCVCRKVWGVEWAVSQRTWQ